MADQSVAARPSSGRRGTRDRILDAAWDVFGRRGFDGATVTEIETRAGLAGGSGGFYRHFTSKEDVLRSVVDREIARADAGRELPPDVLAVDARVALTQEFRRRLSNLHRLQPLVALLAREQRYLADAMPRLRELLIEKNVSMRAEILRGWMDQGAIPRRDPQALATVITAALTGYHSAVQYFGESPFGVDEESVVAMLADLVLGSTRKRTLA